MDRATRLKYLIELLFDNTARIDERDDAAMDLYEYDEAAAEKALITIAKNSDEDPSILNSCGESLGKIWERKNYFNEDIYKSLSRIAKHGVALYLEEQKPDLFPLDSG